MFKILKNTLITQQLSICMDNWTQYPQWPHWCNTASRLNTPCNNGLAFLTPILNAAGWGPWLHMNHFFPSISVLMMAVHYAIGLLVHSVMSSSHRLLILSVSRQLCPQVCECWGSGPEILPVSFPTVTTNSLSVPIYIWHDCEILGVHLRKLSQN